MPAGGLGVGWRGGLIAAPLGLRYKSRAFDAAFQVLELTPGVLQGCRGFALYDDAFEEVEAGSAATAKPLEKEETA